MISLETSVLGMKFENPFLLASAPPTASIESIDKAFSMGWAGAVLKTITPDDFEMFETSPRYAVMRNKDKIIGFQNIELLNKKSVKYWYDGINYLKKKYPAKIIIASIMAPVQKQKWQDLVIKLNETPVDAYELNFSCPHGMPEKGLGMAIGTNSEISAKITKWVKEVSKVPVFVKLSPNVTDVTEIVKAVEKAGADGLAAINTVQGFLGINLDTLEPNLNVDGYSTYGGLSGEIVKPIGLRIVSQIRQTSNLPVLGMGGISTWQDAVQYIAAGSDVVQICTEVMLNGFKIIDELKKGLLNYLENKNIDNILKLKNVAVTKITSYEQLNKNYKLFPKTDATKCVKCGKCIELCFENEGNALSKDNAGNVVLNKDKCLNCSLCKLVCPKQAITMSI